MPARCHCGRFLAKATVEVVPTSIGYYAGQVRGVCAQHGEVDSPTVLSWEEAFGDWDPDSELERV